MATQFHLQRTMSALQIPMDRIQELWISRTEIQVSLPGHSVQRATLYLLVVTEKGEVALYSALHLRQDDQLVFYRCDLSEIRRPSREKLRQLGEEFADSMGFVMDATDWPHMTDASRKRIWGRLLALERDISPAQPAAEPPVTSESAAAPAPIVEPFIDPLTAAELIETRRKDLLHEVGRLLASF